MANVAPQTLSASASTGQPQQPWPNGSRVAEPFEFAPAVRVGASIGLASAPRNSVTADDLLSAADRAMYEAKRRGKGAFVIHGATVEPVSLVPEATPFLPAPKAPALAC